MPAFIFYSDALADHPWRQLSQWLDEGDRPGAVYHWVCDPDEGVFWQVVELADGTVITGNTPRTLEEMTAKRYCYTRVDRDGTEVDVYEAAGYELARKARRALARAKEPSNG